jgi:mono/diheme cytochrome c family protein
MKNETGTFKRWKRASAIIVLSATALLGCAGRRVEEKKGGPLADSGRAAGVTLENVVAHEERTVSYEERQGAYLFGRYCAVCHGLEGKGDGFNAFNLDPRPRDLSDSTYMRALSDAQIMQTINGGGRSVNKSPLMPAYGWTLSRQEIQELSSFVKTLAK